MFPQVNMQACLAPACSAAIAKYLQKASSVSLHFAAPSGDNKQSLQQNVHAMSLTYV